MIFLGIDPGLATIGFGLISPKGSGFSVVDYGIIKTPAGIDDAVRLSMIVDDLTELLRLYKPRQVGIEQLFFQTNVKTAISVAQARGVILETVHRSGAEIFEFTPLQVKQAVTGDGKADKLQVQQMIKLLLGEEIKAAYDDAADALAIALATAQSHMYHKQLHGG